MNKHTIGVNLHPTEQLRNFKTFEESLERILANGLHAVELPIHGLELIRNGQLDGVRLSKYTKIIEQYPLHITTHAPYDLNVFREQDPDVEIDVLEASVDISGALGASVMTYHVGRFISEEQFLYPHEWAEWSIDEREHAMEMERELLQQIGDRAMGLGLMIGMENIRPFPDCLTYCYATDLDDLYEQVKMINHPSVGITLDVGHLHLSANLFDTNAIAQVERSARKIIHVHVHDNFGKPCYSVEKNQFSLLPFGRGDLHMPIGMGSVPMNPIAELILPHYDGIWLHEIRERYAQEWPTLIERTNAFLKLSNVLSVR